MTSFAGLGGYFLWAVVGTALLWGLMIYSEEGVLSALCGAVLQVPEREREGWFFWQPPACLSIYGNVYPPHWSIGREGGDSGFGRSRIWILVSRNLFAPPSPPPPALPPPGLCPLFWKLRREYLSSVPLRLQDHLFAVFSPGLGVWEEVRPAKASGL